VFKKIVMVVILALLVLMLLPVQNVSAQGGDAAKMGSLSVDSIPSQQAVGGAVKIRVKFNVYGGCCYNLYSYDVKPRIEFPPEFTLLTGPEPESYGEITGLSGGEAVTRTFSWTGSFSKAGTYHLEAYVDSDNSGTIVGDGEVTIVSGPAISHPVFFPPQPDSQEDLQVSVDVYSPIRGINVTEVKMYQFISSDDFKDLKADGEILKVNHSGGPRVYRGEEKTLDWSEQYQDRYVAQYEPFDEEKYFYFWYVAKDSEGLVVTSAVNKVEVKDIAKSHSRVRVVFFSFIIVSLAGMISIVLLLLNAENRHKKSKTKLLRLGSSGNIDYMKQKDKPKPVKPQIVYAAFIIILIIAIIFLIYAIKFDGFEIMLQFIKEGK
jgi:hypothetical protein